MFTNIVLNKAGVQRELLDTVIAKKLANCSHTMRKQAHTVDVLSPFISVLCHCDRLFHGESCSRLDIVHPGLAWSSHLCAPGIVPCIICFSR